MRSAGRAASAWLRAAWPRSAPARTPWGSVVRRGISPGLAERSVPLGASDAAAARDYCQSVVAALAIAGAVLLIVSGLRAAMRRVHIGYLDAQALAEKLSVPYPVSALDWPELQVRAVVPEPGQPEVAVLLVGRPGYDEQAATMLVRFDAVDQPAELLSRWCADGASVAPSRRGGREFELRRRQSLERVSGSLLTEDSAPVPLAPRTGRKPRF